MVTIKKSLHLLTAVLFAMMPLVSNAETPVVPTQDTVQVAVANDVHETHEAHAEEHVTKDPSSPEFVQEYVQHHLMDDHYYSFYGDAEAHRHYGFALPVILIDNGLKVFMSSEDFVYNGKVVENGGQHYKYYHGKIYKTDAAGTIKYDAEHHPTNEKPLDFSITKNVVGLLLAAFLLFLGFTALARTYKSSPNNLPKGFARALEPLVIYVRDEMARPNIGDKKYKKFMPYLLSVFFLIFLLNILGLTPLGLNVTGNISVTVCLALFTFLYTNISANADYWKHIFWMPGVPAPMKIVLAPIEVLGMFTKPFSLLIRLFANITAGHSVVMGLIAVAFVMKQSLGAAGATGVSFLLSTFLVFLEILVAFLQAFIFTMLSSLFIGSAVQEHAHDDHH
ncbi:F0F1 ATP synthase subunit A [Flavobacterium sp. xlx-214]|uniref:F0F1 ATP synthase subunit A n=1 Tax=unclassified Flavobacterium TaxID=196869 RepID=UPI0013D6DFBB|nr:MULTISPECIES: F0F1 ATP synthase subunit A [unclassified Flavobacterium]MBA5792016.1 F0F1 ATP synthase subunit A [Flavobacterium sp. xlx-221]QMI84270.1 F0F1 ATP synthase subunit A [Flavobacterium sp. xlx-214]